MMGSCYFFNGEEVKNPNRLIDVGFMSIYLTLLRPHQ